MRAVLRLIAVVAALLAATPARAEEFSAEDLAAIERMFGERIDNALDLCVSDAAPEMAAFEARAAGQGWPAFESVGNWRVANVPPGQDIIISLGVFVEPVDDASIPGTALTCTLLMPEQLDSMLRGHVARKFGTEQRLGVFYLDGGVLRELAHDAWPEGGIPQLFAETPPEQRLVLVTAEESGELVAVKVTVVHRRQ